jgi:hypothetical protein
MSGAANTEFTPEEVFASPNYCNVMGPNYDRLLKGAWLGGREVRSV